MRGALPLTGNVQVDFAAQLGRRAGEGPISTVPSSSALVWKGPGFIETHKGRSKRAALFSRGVHHSGASSSRTFML